MNTNSYDNEALVHSQDADAVQVIEEKPASVPKRKRDEPLACDEPNAEADRLFNSHLSSALGEMTQPKKRRTVAKRAAAKPVPQTLLDHYALMQTRTQATAQPQPPAQAPAPLQPQAQRARVAPRPNGGLMVARRAVPLFPVREIGPEEALTAEDSEAIKLNYVCGWINFRLVEKKFAKRWSGIYLWSYNKSLGKTLLCSTLGKIFKLYWWIFEDEDWQQDYAKERRYECIVYNALNSDLLTFRQIENHGDRQQIVVRRRNQHTASHIVPDTPFIITSNSPPEDLGYSRKGLDINVWKERMLVVCVDNINLFKLIDKLREVFDIAEEQEDEIPAMFPYFEI